MSTHVILLAAGKGTRLKIFFKDPKPLIPFGDEPLLQRTLRQLHEIGLTKITIVTGHQAQQLALAARACYPDVTITNNDSYAEDRNIYSVLCGMQTIPTDSPVLIIEGDVAFSDAGMSSIQKMVNTKRSSWAACGNFQPYQVGGIIRSDHTNRIDEIIYSEYKQKFSSWLKNLGVLYVAKEQKHRYVNLLERYAKQSLDYYYMTPWAENLKDLTAYVVDIGRHGGMSFNTTEEYRKALEFLIPKKDNNVELALEFIDVAQLNHIEEFSPSRVEWLADKISQDGVWTKPLALSKRHYLVMDGQHRMEVAKKMGLSRVPVVFFDYESVPVYSLRPDEYTVTADSIEQRFMQGLIYPYKTAKHSLPHGDLVCDVPLSNLL